MSMQAIDITGHLPRERLLSEKRAPHRVYIRPAFPDLRATVGWHRSLAKGYATTAVRLIDTLRARQVEPESGQERGGRA